MNIAIVYIGHMRLLDIGQEQEGSMRLLKKYVLNKHVRLLTRLYGSSRPRIVAARMLELH